jgi:hypothetical protein
MAATLMAVAMMLILMISAENAFLGAKMSFLTMNRDGFK